MSYSKERRPNRKACDVKAEEVMRSIRQVSGAFDLGELGVDELDLRQDYENAINCLIQSESLIGSLQEQIASKDRQIAKLEDKIHLAAPPKALQDQLASKDREIASLEEKLVEMSLELAVTKTREHELQHRLKTSFTSVASTVSSITISENPSSQDAVATPSLVEARYRPIPNSNHRKAQAPRFRPRLGSCWGGSDDQTLDRSIETSATTVANTTVTDATTSHGGRQRWSLDESNTGRIFGLFGLKDRPLKDGQLVQDFKKNEEEQRNDEPPLEQQPPLHRRSQDQDIEQRPLEQRPLEQRPRRPPNRSARTALQKSSRSFLEARGVVFPVSSFEVMNKGCMERVRNQGSTNDAWPEF